MMQEEAEKEANPFVESGQEEVDDSEEGDGMEMTSNTKAIV